MTMDNAAQPSLMETDTGLSHPKPTANAADTPPARFGIKAKLFLAFSLLACLTAVASAVAWSVFGHIDRSVTHVTVESVPGMVTALSLAEKSAELAATAPALMAVDNQEERVGEQAKLEESARALAALIDDLKASNVAPERTAALSSIEKDITAALKKLNVAVEKSLRIAAQRKAIVEQLSKTHTEFMKTLEPLVDNSVFDLVMRGEDVTAKSSNAITGLVDGGVSKSTIC